MYKRFTRWAKAGVWERIFAMLMEDPKNQYVMIDSTIGRAHQQSAADTKRRPVRLILTGGHVHDVTQAPALVEGWQPSHVIADKDYDNQDCGVGLE